MVVLEGKQYSCDGGAGEAIQLWSAVVVLEGKQYSCNGGAGKAIYLWWCWRGSNTVVMVVQGRQYICGGVGGEAIFYKSTKPRRIEEFTLIVAPWVITERWREIR